MSGSRIAPLLLAAGRSTRMGGVSKLLRTYGGVVLVRRAALALKRSLGTPLTVVTGPDGDGVRKALAGIDARFVVNPRPEEGMASSLRLGVAALPAQMRGVAVMLGDLPSVEPSTILALASQLGKAGKTLVAPIHGGRRGHPVLLDLNAHREEIAALNGDKGARDILAAHPDALLEVEVEDSGILIDLDTEEALAGRNYSPSLAEGLGLAPRELISLVGGGGKTTLMYRLARELSAEGRRAACAVTTRIMAPSPEDGATLNLLGEWPPSERPTGEIPVFGGKLTEGRKVTGIPEEWCDLLFEAYDYLLVEADGSRRLPLKAPGPLEPVNPPGSTLVVAVVGLSCIGKPLDEDHAFRSELISALTGLQKGGEVTTDTLAALLAHPEGLFKGAPEKARRIAFLNQADTPELIALGRETAMKLLESNAPVERIVVGRLAFPGAVEEIWQR